MGLFTRKAGRSPVAGADLDELLAEIARLTEANRRRRDRETERTLLRLRHAAGVLRLETEPGADYAAPDFAALPSGLPELAPGDVTPALLRAGILRDGCLLVRGLVDRDAALGLAAQIDRAFAERGSKRPAAGYYEEFEPDARFEVASVRPWIRDGGGVLATDSPLVTFELMELFEAAGIGRLAGGYLGEPPLISVHKTTLRKAEPTVGGAWHQDGAFMGDVRSLNLWLSLSRCGDEAPGLDIVPRRLDRVVIEHGDMLDRELTQRRAEEAAGDAGIVRPIFEPGDALFFDELFLHQTGSDPSMPRPRFAVESWFFAGSAFPPDYAPVAV
jgi:hypothetical protein